MDRTVNPLVEQGRQERVERSFFYRFSQAISRPFLRFYFNHESFGLENIPDQSGAVVATNHTSNLDPPLVGADVNRPLFTMAKKELHETPVLGSLIRGLYSFPVRRGVLDTSALKVAVSLLEEGNLVLMFPEGTRSEDGSIQRARPGVGKIVAEASVPVIPGYVHGSYEALPSGRFLPKPVDTSVHFGSPLTLDQYRKDSMERRDYEAISKKILDNIQDIKKRVESITQEVPAQDG